MKKILPRLVIELLLVGIISSIIGHYSIKYNIVSLPAPITMLDFQLNIITIVTVFAGFSFSVLGLLISLSSAKIMEKLSETSILEESCKIITKSIIVFMLTFFVALYFISGIYLFIENTLNLNRSLIYSLEIGYLLLGIIIFLHSVYRMVYMLHYIFKDNQKDVITKKQVYEEAENVILNEMNDFHDIDE